MCWRWPASGTSPRSASAAFSARSGCGDISMRWTYDNYAAAMRKVYAGFGDDLDVAALFAESIMNRTPWQLWNIAAGKPAEGADTLEAIAVLEKAMKAPGGDCHPGLLHMYV